MGKARYGTFLDQYSSQGIMDGARKRVKNA